MRGVGDGVWGVRRGFGVWGLRRGPGKAEGCGPKTDGGTCTTLILVPFGDAYDALLTAHYS